MAILSKRKIKSVISKTGIKIQTIYCRMCREYKKPSDFFSAVDELLDTNGYMSVCKKCCNSIYESSYNAEKNLAKAILRTCRIINLKFDEDAVESTKIHLRTVEDNGKQTENIIGIFKSKLASVSKKNFSDKNSIIDLTFHEIVGLALEPENPLEDHEKNAEELKQFWGDKFEREDYVFLESEYDNWKITNPPANRNEETILKLVVLKLLAIRKDINAGKDTSKLEESLTKLLTTGALSPAQANAASQGKSRDCFGEWVKVIERTEPAEWWKDHSIYKDIDNIAEYWKLHILRPFLNFWGIQKDFNFDGAVDYNFEDESLIEESSSEA